MRVAVTGASGNVGLAVLRALVEDDRVASIVGLSRRRPDLELDKVEWVQAHVARDDLEPHFDGADAVVHLAWLIQPGRHEDVLHETNVTGSARTFEAAARAGVRTIVYASSVGAYAAGPKDRRVDESWSTAGIPTSFYSRHKSAVERILDGFEAAHPDVRVVRLRKALIFQRASGSEQRRYFAGPFLPSPVLRPGLIPLVPSHPRLRFQAVHADDVAQAYRLALLGEQRGAFNIAAEPVLDGRELARLLDARPVPVPATAVRLGAQLAYRLRLQPSEAGWVDMGFGVPLMDTTRAGEELGWTPRRSAGEAILDVLAGMREGEGASTPPLRPGGDGPARAGEVAGGVGSRSR